MREENHWPTVIFILIGFALFVAFWLWNDHRRTECERHGGVWFTRDGICLKGERIR